MTIDNQPVSAVKWVKAEDLWANDYNPNRVARSEFRLLKLSLLEDGWTLPLVVRPDGEIVDGFHRWTLALNDPQVTALTDGHVPVVFLPQAEDRGHQIASTIRYNRARGSHYVGSMADIVGQLAEQLGWSREDIERRLGMESEEVGRFIDRGSMVKRGSSDEFGKAWIPDVE